MTEPRLLLCTDMDRTVIPNGVQPEHPLARKRFYQFCQLPNVTLVYVTGRHQNLVKQAIKNYILPIPDYVISDVGTKIYQVKEQTWKPLNTWESEIDKDWHPYSHAQLEELFSDLNELKLQERSKQNTHKLSYYIPLHTKHERLIAAMDERLRSKNIKGSLVWSIDEPNGVGLLDVLPRNATKLHAIEFLQRQLKFGIDEVVFAGDSGNDIQVMESQIHSVLVANAASDVRNLTIKLAKQNNHVDALYLATGENTDMNGNYSAGVLEGIAHYVPAFKETLSQMGITN